ncbi:hypothetical protein V1634_24715 [Plantactinospora veratri]|uniref:Uncharacterized protein n=1 Tax=Plantactinospora veratri TaxID=1436122 RepID=A0ABU7SJA9_9ACTN
MSSTASVPAQPSPSETPPLPDTTPPLPDRTPPETAPVPESPSTPPAAAEPTPSPPPPAPPVSAPESESAKPEPTKPNPDNSAHPTKVRIDTPGASIEIEADEPLAEVVATALRLFHEAGGWPQVNSRSAGFAQAERRETHPVQPSSMPYGPGSYPVQMP